MFSSRLLSMRDAAAITEGEKRLTVDSFQHYQLQPLLSFFWRWTGNTVI